MINRLTASIIDPRDTRYITHTLHDLLAQRVFQLASGYADGNDSDTLRRDPMFKLAANNKVPLDADNPLACDATHSRLENALSGKDIYRMPRAMVLQFIASYSSTLASITLDLDHTADITHGQQELLFYNLHYGNYCYLPLLIFEASGTLVTAVLRPGKRPTWRGERDDHETRAAFIAPALAAHPYSGVRRWEFLQPRADRADTG